MPTGHFQLLENRPLSPLRFSGIPVFQYLKTYWNYWSPFPETPIMVFLELLEFLESCGNDAMGCGFAADFSGGFELGFVGVELALS